MSGQLGTVVIGGGSGFIGTALTNTLRRKGYDIRVISRKPGTWRMTWSDLNKVGLPENTTAVISLAGQNVLDPLRRWTEGFKQNVWASRVNTTRYLAQAIQAAKVKPKAFVTASGISYYPPHPEKVYTEESPGGDYDFLSKLCIDWEEAADLPPEVNVRTTKIRTGVVLGRQGGMVQQLFIPFFFGVGGPISDGSQPMPWIHIDDIVGLFIHAIESENVHGVMNGVAPQIITNKEFTQAFGKAMWRPAVLPLPKFAVNLMFSEERGKLMTEGPKVFPQKAMDTGYQFKYPDIAAAAKQFSKLIYADNV